MSEKLIRDQILAAICRLDEILSRKEGTPERMKDCMSRVDTSQDFWYVLRNFSDRFFRQLAGRHSAEESASLRNVLADQGVADAYLAATVAWLRRKYSLSQPSWMNQEFRIVRVPWFAANSPPMKVILLQESPAAFRVRNLFVCANALSRA